MVIALITVTGCTAMPRQNNNGAANNKVTICKPPRPQICTMDYNPVCAKLKSGHQKTYSNGCSSCSDPNVIEYVDKACAGDNE